MHIASSAFEHQGSIPAKYTCDGENISPPLIFSDVPDRAVSLVLLMDDPDVPKNLRADGMWDHWVVFNIDPSTTEIPEGQAPPGTLGANTYEKNEYGGPCPPDREHRYFFKLFALDIQLSLASGSTKIAVEEAMKEHIIDKAELIGLYNRPENA
ncbi:MAG: YbhB/YbcL family Raf kinase inhibitor-like protein [Patescibacteria group bacterium]